MELLHITPETLTKLQTFESVEQMNEAIKAYKNEYELTEADRNVLDSISRYACKYKGVCYLSKQKIAEEAGYTSRRTAIRACNRMEALGILKQYETRRVKGDRRRSSNVIVINNLCPTLAKGSTSSNSERRLSQSQVTATSHGIEASSKAINSSNTYDAQRIINESIRNNTPAEIVDLLSPFFYGSELYKYVGIVFKAKYRPHAKVRIEAHLEAFRACIFDVIRRYKRGYIRNLDAYLFASIRALSRRLFVENMT